MTRDLSARRYVYVWADGVYLQARMEPLYLAFFQFVHNARKRGKVLRTALVETIIAPSPRNPG